MRQTMKATVFHGVNDICVETVERPRPVPGEAVIRITLTTICGTDLHIVRGEYPVQRGLIIGHEPVGGGKERMRRLMNVVRARRFDPTPLLTHSFPLTEIKEGYRVFGERLDGVMKVAIHP